MAISRNLYFMMIKNKQEIRKISKLKHKDQIIRINEMEKIAIMAKMVKTTTIIITTIKNHKNSNNNRQICNSSSIKIMVIKMPTINLINQNKTTEIHMQNKMYQLDLIHKINNG